MAADTLIETHGLTAFYGDAQALFGIDFELHAGEVVAIIGANGAGKSTFLKALTGLVKCAARRGALQRRADRRRWRRARSCARGMAMVPEGRRLFPSLSVEENLLMGAFAERAGALEPEAPVRAVPDPRARSGARRPRRCRAASSRWWRSAAR